MARSKGDHDNRRIEIAEAACAVILANGIERTRLKDVAAQLGFTTGVLQHYFTDKEALLLFAKNHLFDQAFVRLRSAAPRAQGIDRLRAQAAELLPLTPARLQMYQLLAAFRGQAIGNPELMALQRSRDEMGWALFSAEISALQAAGLVAPTLDPRIEAIGLVAFVEGLATQLITGSSGIGKAALRQLLDNYVDMRFGAA